MSVHIAIQGAAGRMGRRIAALAAVDPELDLTGAVEQAEHPAIGKSLRELGIAPLECAVTDNIDAAAAGCDVLVSFATPEAGICAAEAAAKCGCALVVGTTGFTPEQQETFNRHAEGIPCIHAPNMSVGVNLMFKVVQDIARVLSSGYDVEIIEAHHRLKKDAPSGTAMKLAQLLAQSLNRELDKVGVYERRGMIGERSPEEIGIQTIRAGDIVGEHTVIFGGVGERLEIIHRAHNRDNFARGAVRAANWVVAQPPGFYDMQDVLGLK